LQGRHRPGASKGDRSPSNAYFPLLIPAELPARARPEHVEGFRAGAGGRPPTPAAKELEGAAWSSGRPRRRSSAEDDGQVDSGSYRDLPLLLKPVGRTWSAGRMRPADVPAHHRVPVAGRVHTAHVDEGADCHAGDPASRLDLYQQVSRDVGPPMPVIAGEKTAGERFPPAPGGPTTVEAMMRDGRAAAVRHVARRPPGSWRPRLHRGRPPHARGRPAAALPGVSSSNELGDARRPDPAGARAAGTWRRARRDGHPAGPARKDAGRAGGAPARLSGRADRLPRTCCSGGRRVPRSADRHGGQLGGVRGGRSRRLGPGCSIAAGRVRGTTSRPPTSATPRVHPRRRRSRSRGLRPVRSSRPPTANASSFGRAY